MLEVASEHHNAVVKAKSDAAIDDYMTERKVKMSRASYRIGTEKALLKKLQKVGDSLVEQSEYVDEIAQHLPTKEELESVEFAAPTKDDQVFAAKFQSAFGFHATKPTGQSSTAASAFGHRANATGLMRKDFQAVLDPQDDEVLSGKFLAAQNLINDILLEDFEPVIGWS